MSPALDPVTLEIVWGRLVSIADQQAMALFRSSFSTAVGESEDFASTLHDARGRMIAQSVSTGTISMLTGLSRSVQAIARKFEGDLQPGDAVICNDPWMFSGHTYDVTVASPIFGAGRLVAWCVTCLHAADIGGAGFSAGARTAYEEGLHLPPTKLYRGGVSNRELLELIERNVRMPRQVTGDLHAQVGANEVGGAKLRELLHEYALADVEALADTIIEHSERALREAIRRVPDGTYRHSVRMDGRGTGLTIAAAVEVADDEIAVDFTGSSPQVDYGINGVLNVTFGWTAHAIKSVLAPHVPNNEGLFRPITVTAAEGTLVNAAFPAPTAGRHVLYMYLSGAVFGALSQAIPERTVADSGIISIPSIQGVDERGAEFAYWFLVNNGMGATSSEDGYSGTSFPASVPGPSIEIVENVSPVFFDRLELITGSGGAGRWRGGLAHDVSFRVRTPAPVQLSCMFERVRSPAGGRQGGCEGQTGYVTRNGEPIDATGRCVIVAEDCISVSGGGGGGVGEPRLRPPEAVLDDVRNERVTVEQAHRAYRVALTEGQDAVDEAETARLRATAPRGKEERG